MDDFSKLLSLGGITLGIVGIAGLAVAYFRAKLTETTIVLLRQDRDDAIARAEGIRKDFDDCKERSTKEIADLQEQNRKYEARDSEKNREITMLRNIVTGKEQLDSIYQIVLAIDERLNHDKTA